MTRLSFPMSAASVLARWHRSWTLPLAGGVLVAVVVMLRYTSAGWYFNDYSLPTL
jgi:hypothetical protein